MKARILFFILAGLACLNLAYASALPVTIKVQSENNVLKVETTMAEFEIIVCDMSGHYLTWTANQQNIDISELVPGTYRLHIRNLETGETQWEEFVKE